MSSLSKHVNLQIPTLVKSTHDMDKATICLPETKCTRATPSTKYVQIMTLSTITRQFTSYLGQENYP